jgi:glycosyltransferase involved in cell wall biosynthesis
MTGAADRPLRVLVGMPFGEARGGAERFLRLVAERAAEHGLELHVVLHQEGPLARELEAAGVETSLVPLGRFRQLGAGLRALLALRRLMRAWRPDLVFSWLTRSHVYLAPAAALAGIPRRRVAWWQHHTPRDELLSRIATLVPAAAVFCASEAVAREQRGLWPRRRTIVAHCGIADPGEMAAEELEALRARLGIPPGRAVVGLPGRLVRWKGQDRFLRAVARLRDEGRDVHALVVGGTGHGLDADFEPELRALADELGLAERTTFTGHVADPLPYLRLMDVLVNASVGEPFGLTLLEAQALGVPAVAVAEGGPLEIIEHGESGWLVPSGEPGALAEGIAAVLDDPALARRLSAGGRRSYETRFTAEASVARVAEAMRSVVALAGP